jgi:hypothetical protein
MKKTKCDTLDAFIQRCCAIMKIGKPGPIIRFQVPEKNPDPVIYSCFDTNGVIVYYHGDAQSLQRTTDRLNAEGFITCPGEWTEENLKELGYN